MVQVRTRGEKTPSMAGNSVKLLLLFVLQRKKLRAYVLVECAAV